MTRNGQIVKGIAGFYYVDTSLTFVNDEIYECKAKGNFRNKNLKPLVGDFVEIEIIDSGKKTGNIISVSGRKSELIRPAVSNVDRMILVFAIDDPAPNRNLIDRFLLMMKLNSVEVVLCINKTDICTDNEAVSQLIRDYHDLCGYRVLTVSAKQKAGMDELYSLLDGKTTALAGPSGVGKSTLLKILSQITAPTTGSIKTRGRIASLLEVGTGFHVELTGRENIYLNGTMIGFSEAEIDEKLQVYTTRPDTLFGATYMVVSPEHPFIEEYKDSIFIDPSS